MKLQYTGTVNAGRLHIRNRKAFDSDLLYFNGKEVLITIEKKKSKRSSPQNRYLHGPVLDIIRQGLLDAGFNEARSKDWVKDLVKFKFLKYEVVNEHTGEIITAVRGTSELTKSEFNDFIADLTQWCAEFLNVQIPEPNEQTSLSFDP